MKSDKSVFKYYQQLIQLRKEYNIISEGSIKFIDIDHPQLFVYERELNNQKLLVITNHFGIEVPYEIPQEGKILLSNIGRETISADLVIKPYEALVIALNSP